MPAMTDPSAALSSFQVDLALGRIPLQQGQLDPNIFMTVDFPSGRPRFIYLTIEDKTITGIVIFAMVEMNGREPLFQLGIAIPEAYRQQGRAKRLAKAAIAELQHGSAKSNVPVLSIEAVVAQDNLASNKVMAECLNPEPTVINDSFSGESALHYTKRFVTTSNLV